MKKIFRSLIWVCLFACGTTVFAQNRYVVSGVLKDSVKQDKIFYATVALLTADSTEQLVTAVYSDAAGKFALEDVTPGKYVLKATLVGYNILRREVEVGGESRRIQLGELNMVPGDVMLQGIAITEQMPVYMMDGEKTLYNVAEDPTIHSGTAVDALQNSPGVEVDIEGNITLRGVSSVEIWLNGKPSNMNEDALKEFLRQMPASTIQKIEVITNPSAKYSAKGTGGIINVVTTSQVKKNSFVSFGLHGSTTPTVRPWVSYVWANEKFSISAYASYNYWYMKSKGWSQSTLFNDAHDTSSVYLSDYDNFSTSHNMGLYVNGTYTPDTLNTISFWAGTGPSWSQSHAKSTNGRIEYINNPGCYDHNDASSGKGNSISMHGGLRYVHAFNSKGHEISADASYWGYVSRNASAEKQEFVSALWLDRDRKNASKTLSHNVSASLDYTLPYHPNGEIEMGISGDYSRSDIWHQLDTLVLGTESTYWTDSLRLQKYATDDGGFDAYVTIQHRFGGFTIKGGLRTECTAMNYNYPVTPQHDFSKVYWGLFPSLHLSYRTKSMYNFKLSYTRRVSNPSGSELTTWINYDDDSYYVGNPNLRSSFSNSLEAGWTKFINKFGNIALNAYFRNTKDQSSDLEDVIFSPVLGRYVTFSQPINAGKTLNTGLDLNVTYQLKAFMSIRFYTNMYYQKQQFQFRDDEAARVAENFVYSFRLNFWAKLWKVLEVNLSGSYRSKSKSLFSVTKPRYSIDCGLRADFWKRRISVHLNVSDIFNWNKTSVMTNSPYYVHEGTSRNSWGSRAIRAGITFRFGKMELESKASQGGMDSQPSGMQ